VIQAFKPFELMTVSGLLLAAVSVADAQETQVDEGQPVLPAFVKTTTVPVPQSTITREFFGRIVARETVDVSFEVPGYLSLLNATEGTIVEQGTVVASLDLDGFERGVERAEISLAQAERNLDRARTLTERRISSAVAEQDAETARDLAEVQLKEAREALEDATLEAPFDALVAERKAPLFSTVDVGQPIVQLHDMSEIRVEFDLPERIFNLIGGPADKDYRVSVPGIAEPLPVKFVEYAAATGAIGQTYMVTLAFNGAREAERLIPGTSVTITAAIEVPGMRPTLPASAIFIEPDRSASVFVVDGDDEAGLVARKTRVEVSSTGGTAIAVTGIEPGTEIVEVGVQLLRDGQAVQRFAGLTLAED